MNDFYIGYEPEMPASLAGRVRGTAALLVVMACMVAVGLVLTQARFGDGVFEFGREREFEGRVTESPYPVLHTTQAHYWLVGPGKHGAASIVAGHDGRTVRITGTLIERGSDAMVQVEASAIAPVAAAPATPTEAPHAVGSVVLEGEIVDSKCHLGVMKPGEGPVHRDCATRCLSGGVPPMLVVRSGGLGDRLLLVSPSAGRLDIDLEPLVARPVRVRGVLYERGEERYLGVARDGISVLD